CLRAIKLNAVGITQLVVSGTGGDVPVLERREFSASHHTCDCQEGPRFLAEAMRRARDSIACRIGQTDRAPSTPGKLPLCFPVPNGKPGAEHALEMQGEIRRPALTFADVGGLEDAKK